VDHPKNEAARIAADPHTARSSTTRLKGKRAADRAGATAERRLGGSIGPPPASCQRLVSVWSRLPPRGRRPTVRWIVRRAIGRPNVSKHGRDRLDRTGFGYRRIRSSV